MYNTRISARSAGFFLAPVEGLWPMATSGGLRPHLGALWAPESCRKNFSLIGPAIVKIWLVLMASTLCQYSWSVLLVILYICPFSHRDVYSMKCADLSRRIFFTVADFNSLNVRRTGLCLLCRKMVCVTVS